MLVIESLIRHLRFKLDRLGGAIDDVHDGGCGARSRSPLELKAGGIDCEKVVASHVVRPPGARADAVVEADFCGWDLLADGSDWVRVYAKVCDARGTVCPFADDMIMI